MKSLDPIEKLERENERLKARNAQLSADNRKFRRRSGGFLIDEAVEDLKSFLADNADLPIFAPTKRYKAPSKPVPVFGKDHFEWVGACWSDWHTSETVRPEDTLGMNKYNSMITSNRAWGVVDTTKKIIVAHSVLYPIKGVWLTILGDNINGPIHEGSITNDQLDLPAATMTARIMIMGIEELKTLGVPIVIDCVVGNHPRLTLHMPTKRQAYTSFDYIIYEMLQIAFRGDDQVTISVHTGPIGARNILGHRYLFEHGIGVKHGQEEQFENRLRGVFDDEVYREATGLQGASFDHLVIGNIHTPKFLQRTVVNGSLVGQNELGVDWRLNTIRAQQMLWGISEKRVRTWQYPIDVTAIRSDGIENPFSEYAGWHMERFGRN